MGVDGAAVGNVIIDDIGSAGQHGVKVKLAAVGVAEDNSATCNEASEGVAVDHRGRVRMGLAIVVLGIEHGGGAVRWADLDGLGEICLATAQEGIGDVPGAGLGLIEEDCARGWVHGNARIAGKGAAGRAEDQRQGIGVGGAEQGGGIGEVGRG